MVELLLLAHFTIVIPLCCFVIGILHEFEKMSDREALVSIAISVFAPILFAIAAPAIFGRLLATSIKKVKGDGS